MKMHNKKEHYCINKELSTLIWQQKVVWEKVLVVCSVIILTLIQLFSFYFTLTIIHYHAKTNENSYWNTTHGKSSLVFLPMANERVFAASCLQKRTGGQRSECLLKHQEKVFEGLKVFLQGKGKTKWTGNNEILCMQYMLPQRSD